MNVLVCFVILQRLPPMGNGVVATGEIAGMITLMRVYENELKNPIWNVITGGLARALLIQVQKLKTDVEAAMLQLDSILSANELNVAMIAAIPSVLIAGGLLYLVVQRIRNSGPDPFISTTPCRYFTTALSNSSLSFTRFLDFHHRQVLILISSHLEFSNDSFQP